MDILYDRGTAFASEGDFLGAIVDFTAALKLTPTDVQARYNRGHCYFQLEKFELAIADFTVAIDQDPNYLRALFGRARGFFLLGDTKAAEQDFAVALERGGPEWEMHEEVLEILESLEILNSSA